MPSHKHQSLTKLVTESPKLVPVLVRDLLGLDVPEDFELMPSPETIREIKYPEYSADGTVLIQQSDEVTREAFIVEVQLRPDDDKNATWPLYVSEGRAEGEAKALLLVLESRGLVVSDEARARITACTDIEQLDAWLSRAASADSVDAIFGD
ncbi:MAG: hypothetical protein AAGF11_49560 [Myxococcota bacterium]